MNILKSKKLRRIGAIALGACVIAGTVLGVGYSQGWFNSSEELSAADNGSGFTVSDTANNGIKLTSVATQGSGTFNSKTYESSTTISATVTPSDATDLTVTWSLAWAEDCDDTISDYVALSSTTSTSEGEITVYCYQPFGTQIILTATADGGISSAVTGTATLDYYKSFTDVLLYNYDSSLSSEQFGVGYEGNVLTSASNFYNCSVKLGYGTGTLKESYSSLKLTFSYALPDDVIKGITSSYVTDYTFDLTTVSESAASTSAILANVFYKLGYSTTEAGATDFVNDYYSYLIGLFNGQLTVSGVTYYDLFNVTAEITGAESGKVSTFDFEYCIFDPSGYYTEATAVTLNETNLYF